MLVGKLNKKTNAEGDLLLTLDEQQKNGILVTNLNFGSYYFNRKNSDTAPNSVIEVCLYDEKDNIVLKNKLFVGSSLVECVGANASVNVLDKGFYMSLFLGCFVMLPDYKILLKGVKDFVDEMADEPADFNYSYIDCYLSFLKKGKEYVSRGGIIDHFEYNDLVRSNYLAKSDFMLVSECNLYDGYDIIEFKNDFANDCILTIENYDKKLIFNGKEMTFAEFMGYVPNLTIPHFDRGGNGRRFLGAILPYGSFSKPLLDRADEFLALEDYFVCYCFYDCEVTRKSKLWYMDMIREGYLARLSKFNLLGRSHYELNLEQWENEYQELSELRYGGFGEKKLSNEELIGFLEVEKAERTYNNFEINTNDLKKHDDNSLKLYGDDVIGSVSNVYDIYIGL